MKTRNIIILTAGMFFLSSVYTMLVPFLPLYLMDLGVEGKQVNFWSGAVFSVCFLIGGIMGPIWGRLADSKGKKKMAVRAAFFIGLSYLLGGLVRNQWELLGMRMLQGFANGYMPAAMAMISSSVSPAKLGVTLGFFQTALTVGGICGPLMGGILSEYFGMRASFFVGGSIVMSVAAVVFFFVHEENTVENTQKQKEKSKSVFQDLSYAVSNKQLMMLLSCCFVLQSSILMIQPVAPLYIGELQGSMNGVAMTAGLIMSLGGIAGAVTTPFWGLFGQKYGYDTAMAVTFAGAGILLIGQGIPQTVMGFGIFQFAVGCFIVGINPSVSAAMVTCTPNSFRGRVFGLANTFQQFGSMFGPMMAGIMTMYIDIRWMFIIAGVLLSLIGWALWKRTKISAKS
jgi:DHA1 family multidrug resistance protein-like MFS transporter